MAILTANQLSKVYGHKQKYRALNNISFSVEKGEFVAVMVLLDQVKRLYSMC